MEELKISRFIKDSSLSSKDRFLVAVTGVPDVSGAMERDSKRACVSRAVELSASGFDSVSSSGELSLRVHDDASDKAGELDLVLDAHL